MGSQRVRHDLVMNQQQTLMDLNLPTLSPLEVGIKDKHIQSRMMQNESKWKSEERNRRIDVGRTLQLKPK